MANTPTTAKMTIRVIRSRGVAAMPSSMFLMRRAASPMTGIPGRSKCGAVVCGPVSIGGVGVTTTIAVGVGTGVGDGVGVAVGAGVGVDGWCGYRRVSRRRRWRRGRVQEQVWALAER